MIGLFTGFRAGITQGRVPPTPIIERFDVKEKVSPRLVAGAVHSVMHQLTFQRTKEAFHQGIIVPIPGAIHTDLEPWSFNNV